MTNRMFIGNQTSCWSARPIEPFEYALANGFDAFEWFPDKKTECGWDDQDLDASLRRWIRDSGKERGMRLSVHARWQANPLDPSSRALFERDIQLALDVGAVLLNIHFAEEREVEAFVEAIRHLAGRTAAVGLQLAIENTPHHTPEQFNELFAQLQRAGNYQAGHVGMCLDIGHANLSAATRNDYLAFVDRLYPEVPIIHVHMHENWGDSDTHLAMFTGPAARNDLGVRGLVDRLKRRSFSGSIILEQWPSPPSQLNVARDRLLELWGPIEDENPPVASPQKTVLPTPRRVVPQSPGRILRELAEGNARCRSWREKLELVNELLAREDPAVNSDDLILIAIYLRFLSAGQIACVEDGRHFRPAHHAKLAAQIYSRLAELRRPENESILRKIYPALPSDSPEFQRPEPLTRIRDIAHRNDIDAELKREIKTRLQNKLHRCADPEDLVTSAELLQRVTAPGTNYSPGFVEQFKIFHSELQEFFNASSLDDRLRSLGGSVPDREKQLIDAFLAQKSANALGGLLSTLRTLTELRDAFAKRLETGLKPLSSELILADIGLEDFAFVLLSDLINQTVADEKRSPARTLIEALRLSLRNAALSGVDPAESRALQSELSAWGEDPLDGTREEKLRWRASLLRCRRFASEFGTRTVKLFAGKAEAMGSALGISERAAGVFSEAEIRSNVVFQTSKMADSLLVDLRKGLGMTPWDVVVPGNAVGKVVAVESLAAAAANTGGRSIVVLGSASGDEEITGQISAIALGHELAHLAHLSVRARQAGVVLVTCEDSAEFEKLRSIEGR